MEEQSPSPALFFDTISAYERTEALRAAIELDLFMRVAEGQRTAAELAGACEAAPRGVRILADYLTVIGFLKKHDDRYELTPRKPGLPQPPLTRVPRRHGGLPPHRGDPGLLSEPDGGRAPWGNGGLRGGDGLAR
jgi:hypothetical protein